MSPGDRVRELAGLLEGSGIGLLELETAEGVFRLQRGGAPGGTEFVTEPDTAVVRAPSVGVFRVGHPLLEAPLAAAGRAVVAGDVVGLMEVGVLLLHVVAPADGVIAEVMAADGAVVGYGAALMTLEAQ